MISRIKKAIRKVATRFADVSPVVDINIVALPESELLLGRYAVITGGSSGIGLAIARAMLKAGAKVVIIGRNVEKLRNAIESVNKEENKYTDSIYSVCHDVTGGTALLLEKILKRIPRVDIFVNNAGILGGVFGYTDEKEFDNVMMTNVRAPFMLTQEISKYFIENDIRGNILNILSSSSFRPANSAYMASKWAMLGLNKGFAKILVSKGITVNGIAPGPTATPMLKDDDDMNYYHPTSPIHRYIMPEEIANMAVVLTSALGRSIVGEVVCMTGGCGSITYDDISY